MTAEGHPSELPPAANIEHITAHVTATQGVLPHPLFAQSAEHLSNAFIIVNEIASCSTELLPVRDELAESIGGATLILQSLKLADAHLGTYIANLTASAGTTSSHKGLKHTTEHPRIGFQNLHGFTIFTDLNDRLMDRLSNAPVPRLADIVTAERYDISATGPTGAKLVSHNPAGFKLYLVMTEITRTIPTRKDFARSFGMTDADRETIQSFAFAYGLADTDFPWHFSAVVADAMVDFFVDQGVLTKEQKDAFTLRDWANIIGSGWFSRTMHLLALAPTGTYESLGKMASHYQNGALLRTLRDIAQLQADDPVFEYKEQTEPDDGAPYHTAAVKQKVVKGLRGRLESAGNSRGCPVARYSLQVSEEEMSSNRHIQNLVANGTLVVVPERSGDGRVYLRQEWSAIDKTLSLFAAQLDRYQHSYGDPLVQDPGPKRSTDNGVYMPRIVHVQSEPLNLLKRPPTTVNEPTASSWSQ